MTMSHPKVVETYEHGTSLKGEPVIVMEYVAGPSMQNIVVQKLEHHIQGKRLTLIRDMAEALQYVHEKNYIHRDICPRNFICKVGVTGVKLIDFGLTIPDTPPFRLPGNRTGTPLYMSPEIVRRRATDRRVDVFSFGVTCFCLCAFEHPWQGAILNGRAALQHDSRPPSEIMEVAPKLNPKLGRAIMEAMHPDVDQRTPDMATFLKQIERVDSAFVANT